MSATSTNGNALFIKDQKFMVADDGGAADPFNEEQHPFQPAFMQAIIGEWKRLQAEVKIGWLYTL